MSLIVKTEADGQVQVVSVECEQQEEQAAVPEEDHTVFAEAGIGLEQFSDSSQEVPDLEYQPQQDLVSLALETSNVGVVAGAGVAEVAGLELGTLADGGEDYPDEIECQLIQKSVFMNGQVQTIDFIMCNQCPRLFRTENLLWNHIKAKHKRRNFRRLPEPRRTGGVLLGEGELEPGEIQDGTAPAPQPPQQQLKPELSPGAAAKRESLYVVGLDKSGSGGRPGNRVQSGLSPEKYQRQKARKRIYVDSNIGPFKCPGCDIVTFNNRRSLDLHMKRVHKAGIVECDECGRKVLDLKRHKEILHKRFKIYDCPHCSDKYCTQEDLERHLAKIEKNNMVEGSKVKPVHTLPIPPKEPKEPEQKIVDKEPVTSPETAGEKEKPEEPTSKDIVKELESKTYSCSECGLKTPSRMTYIQHVLNGCIMDMVLGESEGKGKTKEGKEAAAVAVNPPVKRGRGRPPLDRTKKLKADE